MLKAMRRAPMMEMVFVLDDTASDVKQLYFIAPHTIQGWPQEQGEDVPVDLDGYVDFIGECDSRIAAIQEIVTSAVATLTAAMDNKVDKVAGKGLSTYDLTQALCDSFAKAVDFRAHVEDAVRHITAEERIAWNKKADEDDIAKKQDAIVQDGYIYIPDRMEGYWHRLQASFDAEMGGVVGTYGDDTYIKNADGKFELLED